MPPHFFKNKEMVTKEVYVNVLASVVKSWMETVAFGGPCFSAGQCTGSRAIWFKTGFQTISIYFGPRNSGLLIAQI